MTDQSFPDVGGHVAVSLVNTRPIRGGERVELLNRYDELVRWACQAGLIDPVTAGALARRGSPKEKEHALSLSLGLREQLERAFQARPGGADLRPLLAAINAAVGERRARQSYGLSEGKIVGRFEAPLERPSDLAAAIAEAAAGFYASDLPGRLRQCAGSRCVLWFVDTSRNRSRHWCRMDRCGARAKSGAYYRRKKSEGGPPVGRV